MTVATNGREEMPSFRLTLSEKDLRDVAAYASRLMSK
jgi:mono/diheme cytochrome c family protein